MARPSLVGYVGDVDFNDGSVFDVEHRGSEVRIRVRGASGGVIVVGFSGVNALRVDRPEGMVLYALSELSGEPPLRRFAFTNRDEDGEEYLEVDAMTLGVSEE